MEFNETYIRRLKEGDAATEEHFSTYFGELLRIKLRSRLRSPQLMEDIRQETFVRVLRILREGGGLDRPERLGSFVNSVCNNVLLETFRAEARHQPLGEGVPEPEDEHSAPDAALITEERKREVKRVLDRLPGQDRNLLRMIFFEERDKAEVCRELGVEPGYMRVLLYRAKARFRQKLKSEKPALVRAAQATQRNL